MCRLTLSEFSHPPRLDSDKIGVLRHLIKDHSNAEFVLTVLGFEAS